MDWNELVNTAATIWNFKLFTMGETAFSVALVAKIVAGLVAAWFISQVLRIAIFQRLLARTKMERGVQFAIARMGYYITLVIALLVVVDTAGLQLGSLAIFGGLVGVGLGFGMQNIAANFVSGVILLLERPVKVGDAVTVDDMQGIVESISMRVTKLLTYDNVMVYVPNSRFVNENVINWSAEDAKVRVHVDVGVSYSSDVEKVREILLQTARDNQDVLDEPAPAVWFTDFGDSALTFRLLAWVPNPSLRAAVPTALRFAITKAFRQNDVEIPFPQRDIHVRSSVDLPIEMDGQS